MSDFHAKTHACRFIHSIHDLVLPNHRHYQAHAISGSMIRDNDSITVVPLANDRAQVFLRTPGDFAKLNLEMRLVIPTFAGAKPHWHWLYGEIPAAPNPERWYLFKLDDSSKILLWRYSPGNAEAVDAGKITYPTANAPAAPVAGSGQQTGGSSSAGWQDFQTTPAAGSPLAWGTQDDEGSGEEPIP